MAVITTLALRPENGFMIMVALHLCLHGENFGFRYLVLLIGVDAIHCPLNFGYFLLFSPCILVVENRPGDFNSRFHHISKGAWTFADRDHGLQLSDGTAECLKCCLLLSMLPEEIVGEKLEPERLNDSVNVLLSLQLLLERLALTAPPFVKLSFLLSKQNEDGG
ncbi:hypothetical protein V8G54_032683 [Vigna mungo]|uniref:Uncharacterized protein n=1 Tax=Vigna mungo TaxID=3915 RepID=A0AAQ3RJ13_VIGMU